MYDMKLVGLIREIRKDNPSWSAKKIRVILSWEMEGQYVLSILSIGRIIKKYNMFYRSDIQACKKRRKPAGKAAGRKRKPYNLKARRQHEIIEFDMKQINLPGKILYALCAIDQINDNGSENMGKAEQWLKEEQITQYRCRPNKPKDKPFIERFIGTLQTECLDYHYELMNVHELQQIIDEWIFKYENQRPHEGLNFLTPKQFEAMFYAQKHSLVS